METRRSFIRKGALGASAAASALLVPAPLWSRGSRVLGANDRIGIGLIGCNGMGFSNLSSFLKLPEVQVTALCDVHQGVLERRTAQLTEAGHGKPKQYGDYRELLENADVDIVIIGTPDHWHCLQLLDALDAGKDVYARSPLQTPLRNATGCCKQLRAAGGWSRLASGSAASRILWMRLISFARGPWGRSAWQRRGRTRVGCSQCPYCRTARRLRGSTTRCGWGRRPNAPLTQTASILISVGSGTCLLYTSPSPRDRTRSRMPSSA